MSENVVDKPTKLKELLGNTAMLTLIAMVIGAILGLAFGPVMNNFKFIGTIWLNSIKMIVVPLILCILVTAIATQKDAKTLGRIATKIVAYYFTTTIIACVIGMVFATILKPGLGVVLNGIESKEISTSADITVSSFFTSLFSKNMFGTFSSGNLLQTMVISIMLGFTILSMKNESHKSLLIDWFQAANSMIFRYIGFVIKLAPIGVLFLIAASFGKYGVAILGSMAGLLGTYWLSIIAHVLITYCMAIWIFGRINPISFLKKSMPVWTFTIASCSSAATIPISIKTAKENFSIPERIANFCIPLGAQMNTDGTAVMFSAVLIFIGQLYGIDLPLFTLFKMVLVATLLASSGGGIPGGGIIKLLILVEAFGLPVEMVGIIAGFYRLFDMGSTTGNCLGDLAGTVVVTKSEEIRNNKLGLVMEQV